jgi:hypothetical protein
MRSDAKTLSNIMTRKLFLGGGLGDAQCVLNHLDWRPDEILVASPAARFIREFCLINSMKCTVLEQIKPYISLWELQAKHGEMPGIEDGNISVIFPRIVRGELQFHGKYFERWPRIYQVPDEYDVLVPWSVNTAPNRNMSTDEICHVIDSTDRPLVLLHQGKCPRFSHPRIVDLTNQLSLSEAFSVVCNAKQYFGLDSSLANYACWCGIPARIKSTNVHYYRFRKVYCAPNHDQIHIVSTMLPNNWQPVGSGLRCRSVSQ